MAATSLSGCGLTNQRYSVAWTATLDRQPGADCTRDALASLPDVFRADLKSLPQGFVASVYLKPAGVSDDEMRLRKAKLAAQLQAEGLKNYREWPDIYVSFGDTRPGDFRMDYMGWPATDHPREVAAREIVAKLAVTCGIPELPARVKEDRHSEWLPYMFNI